MDSEIKHLDGFYRFLAWVEKSRKQLIWGVAAAMVVGLGLYYYNWQKENSERVASEELSQLRPTATPSGTTVPVAADAYLKIVAAHPGTQAAARAMLLAAGTLFTDAKYAEARVQFDRFLRDYPDSPLRGEALLGSGACLEAQGEKAKAAEIYKDIVDHHSGEAITARAKLALARCYEATKQPELAYPLYEELSQSESFNSVGLMADVRLEDLKQTHPQLAVKAVTNTMTVKPGPAGTSRAATPKSGAATVKTNKP